ncbi:MAG: tRNA A37 threonylcarbamoyladenosine synthetase subunit TsaC/SUA5/YrdC [Candidatus Methanohalarchaeum thermophilum]|uniref:L-threonylcarbamoyladenylate synthase n=1 Tax=Methanohalarchaeum thermophilum TaxID=1903181 RepID=A0A1Q6DTL0_METT1|nr:MAG: tRNA A37 threonylcarbamoyladenosine synthetase subunit TsaC/SUA5/YrdC [Candidatus Methanohalarchaeum thermophilum]
MFKKAVNALKNKEVIVYPTETVYGLGADAKSSQAIKKVFEVKKRPLNKPISIAVSSMDMIEEVAKLNYFKREIIKKILPGPVTLLLDSKNNLPDNLTAGSNKIGIRMPDNELALKIIKRFGGPITSTSANISGTNPPNTPREVNLDVDVVVDNGRTILQLPSTIIDLEEGKIKRRGPLTKSSFIKIFWN